VEDQAMALAPDMALVVATAIDTSKLILRAN
jgi:hypothetical protein